MSIKTDIERELKRIQAVSGRGLLQVDADGGRIEADLLAVDAIGCSFQTLAYSTDKLAGAVARRAEGDQRDADRQADVSAGADRRGRSRRRPLLGPAPQQPAAKGRRRHQLLRADGPPRRRHHPQPLQKKPGQLRQIVPAHVTREVLGRLADDFVAAVE